MKIIERRTMTTTELRSVCIQNDWYTRGTCAEYDHLFDLVRDKSMTANRIYKVAKDIYEHSNFADPAEDIPVIMMVIENHCISEFEIREDA